MSAPLTARSPRKDPLLTPTERILRRKLIAQDGLSLLILVVIAIGIGVLTHYFFQSFRQHRSVLEKRWFDRGEKALVAGRPADAVLAFRSALSLSTANPNYERALAEALAQAGRTNEAYAYFSSLHSATPGDGFLNLQLARLSVQRNEPTQAVSFYLAALNGLWYGEGTERRFDIRLELAKYLMTLNKPNEAQGQLLAAEGNSLDQPGAVLEIANLLTQAGDPSDAWTAYRRVERQRGAKPTQTLAALQGEANVAESMGQYKRAALALDRYAARVAEHPKAATAKQKDSARKQSERLQRMLQLIPFYALPPKQHSERVLHAAAIAHKRYTRCLAQLQAPEKSNPAPKNAPAPSIAISGISDADAAQLASLGTQWKQLEHLRPQNLAGDAPLAESVVAWTGQVETLTAKLCGPPTGDDALLLQLARTPDKTE